jgi:hypothetical protein
MMRPAQGTERRQAERDLDMVRRSKGEPTNTSRVSDAAAGRLREVGPRTGGVANPLDLDLDAQVDHAIGRQVEE